MRIKRLYTVIVVILLAISPLSAQDELPIRWDFYVETISDSSVYIIAVAQIEPGWRLFAPDASSAGCVPFTMSFDESDDYVVEGEMFSPFAPKAEYDSIQHMNLLCFREKAEFRQLIKLNTQNRIVLTCTLFGQCCNKAQKVCAPVMKEEKFYLNFNKL